MAETYVRLEEAAELEGEKYHTLNVRVNRSPGKYKTKTIKSEAGGRDAVMVAVSSLSKKARMAFREREQLKELAEIPQEDPEAPPDRPWYTTVDIDWFMQQYPQKWYKAVEAGNTVREVLDYTGKDKTEFVDRLAQERLGRKGRTLYNMTKDYLVASAWADRMRKQDGGDYEFFKVLCLCRKPKEVGNFPSFTPEVKQVIKNIWFNKEFAQNLSSKEMLYEKLQAVQRINKWEKIPSYQSVVRYINFLMEDEGMRNAWYLASRGEREYKNKRMVKGERDTSDLLVMEVLMGDEHTFDCWVSYRNPKNGKVMAIRPRLVAWIDIRSRRILGDLMCQHCNSQTLKLSLFKMMYYDAGSVPKNLYVDNGADYVCKDMTGRKRYDRGGDDRKEIWDVEFEDAELGFYKSIGIEDVHRALPYYAWTKGQIERFFGTVCGKFSKWFTSYTGTLTGSKTFAKVKKDVKGMLERGELLTLEEFYEKWHEWLTTVYDTKAHSALKQDEFKTPKACFENADRYDRAVPPKKYATMLMLKSAAKPVKNVGISLEGGLYRSEELCRYIDSKVDVKWDPYDLSTIYIFRKGKQLCEAYLQKDLPFAVPNGEEPTEELKAHLAMQKAQLKEDNRILKEANEKYDKMYPGLVGFEEMGGLMIGKKPKNNVVQMPTDKTYRNGFRVKEPEENEEENEYFSRKAEEALKTLRAL